LKKALKHHRVLTVHRRLRGAKKDFGVVGLEPARNAQFLVFPKSLRSFADRRVVGIDYDLLADAISVVPAPKERNVRARRKKPPPRAQMSFVSRCQSP
jgi:hypothetical protein